jgi:hypothetical protein
MHSGKTTASRVVGSKLFATRMYNVYQWSFATTLKNFCMRYYDAQAGVTSGVMEAYYSNKLAVPPSAKLWAGTGSVTLPPSSVISELLIVPSADLAARVRARLLKIFALDLAEGPGKLCGRRIMQVTGSVFRDICGMDFWIKQLENSMSSSVNPEGSVNLIDDVRFPNEAEWVKSIGGAVIRIVTPPKSCEPPKHISEMCVKDVSADFVFENGGTSVAALASGLMPFALFVVQAKPH